MTSYTAIPDTSIDPEAPVTSELMTLLRDNPIAISEGGNSAPKVQGIAIDNTQLPIVVGNGWVGYTNLDNVKRVQLFLVDSSIGTSLPVRLTDDAGANWEQSGIARDFGSSIVFQVNLSDGSISWIDLTNSSSGSDTLTLPAGSVNGIQFNLASPDAAFMGQILEGV